MPDRSLGFDVLVSVDARKAERTIRNLAREMNRRITQAVNSLPDIEIDAKSTGAQRRIAEIRKELQALGDKKVGVDIDANAARAELRRLQSELRQLGSQSESIQVRADTAAAAAALGNLDRQAKRLDGQTVQMTARVNGDRALTMIGLITAGLGTMGAVAPAAGAAVAASLAGAGAAAQGLGTLAIGFSGVSDAVDALTKAEVDLAKGGEDAAKAQEKLDEELRHLSPEAQRFARFLQSEMLPALRGVRDAVQETMLPRMETAMRNMAPVIPVISEGLAEAGRVTGDLAVRGSQMMSSGPWRADFTTIMASNNRALESFGNAGLSVADSWRHLAVAGGPLLERLANATERGAELASQWLATKRATGELDTFMAAAGDTLFELFQTLGQVAMGAGQVALALGPVGGILLAVIGKLAEMIGNFAQANPTITAWVGGMTLATVVVAKLGTTITGLVATSAAARMGIGHLTGALSLLVPANMQAKLAGMTGMIDASGNATERASGKVGTLVGGVSKLGSFLPVAAVAAAGYTIAMDSLTISQDEASAALLQGGAAAQQATEKLQQQTGVITWLDENIGKMAGDLVRDFGPSMNEATAAVQAQLAAMDPLARAQALASQAAADHRLKVEQFGPQSQQAAATAWQLATAQDNLARAQGGAGNAAESHTDKLIRQRNEMLGNVAGEIQWEAALDRLTESVARNGATTDLTAAEGRELRTNLDDLAMAAIRNLESMNAQGAGIAAVAARQAEYRQRLIESAIQTGMTREEARRYVDQLNLVPSRIDTTVHANTGPAAEAIRRFIESTRGQEIVLKARADTGNIMAGARAAGGVYDPMARGGVRSMRRDVAQVVPPNQPVLMGDRMRGREWFLPDDDKPRTMAAGHDWAAARGLRLVPMTDGGVLGMQAGGALQVRHGSVSPEVREQLLGMGYRGNPADQMEALYVPPEVLRSLQDAEAQFTALTGQLTEETIPAMDLTGQRHTQLAETVRTATGSITSSVGALNLFSNTAWMDMQARVGAEVGTMIGPHFGALNMGHQHMELSQLGLQNLSNFSWANMTATTGMNVGQITGPIFGGLHAGLRGVADHASRTADWWGGQLGRIRALTADPIRWTLDFPINRGLVPAWGEIDRFFALGRPWGGVPIGFAGGGRVEDGLIRGDGTGTSDSIPARTEDGYPLRVSRGEFIMPADVTARHKNFLYALRDRQAEAVQAAGGRYATGPGFAAGGAVPLDNAIRVARSMHGKRYVWGGGSAAGTDCSGYQAFITRALRMEPNPYRRIGTTGDFPWGGFRPGLGSAYSVGNKRGNPGHMAGTLGGVNVEAGGSHNTSSYGGRAVGADHPQFTMRYHLPEAGGRFAPGGGGGGGFDVAAFLNEKLSATRRMISDIRRFHGNGNVAAAAEKYANDAVAGVVRYATEHAATSGTVDPGGTGVERWRPLVHRMLNLVGQPVGHDNITLRRMNQESGGNPRAINNWDINAKRGTPSKGLMQVIDPTFRAHRHPQLPNDIWDPGANVAASMRYALSRYGSLPTAYNRPGGYDRGGVLRHGDLGLNLSGHTERVLSPAQTRAFDRLVDILNTRRGQTMLHPPAVTVQAPGGGMPDMAGLIPAVARAVGAQVAAHLDGVKLKFADDGQAGIGRIANRQNFLSARRE